MTIAPSGKQHFLLTRTLARGERFWGGLCVCVTKKIPLPDPPTSSSQWRHQCSFYFLSAKPHAQLGNNDLGLEIPNRMVFFSSHSSFCSTPLQSWCECSAYSEVSSHHLWRGIEPKPILTAFRSTPICTSDDADHLSLNAVWVNPWGNFQATEIGGDRRHIPAMKE